MYAIKMAVLYRHTLFASGVTAMLRHNGYDVTAVDVRAANASSLLRWARPAVIVVQDDDGNATFSARLADILAQFPTVGVVRVNLGHNSLGVYSARQVVATEPQDLFDTIEQLLYTPELAANRRAALPG